MRFFYFIILFFSSLLLADISAFPIVNVGMSLYPIDIFFGFFILCFFIISIRTKFQFYDVNKSFLFFIGILILSICYGITKYGFSAIGEGRYIYWLFFFSVPVFFYLNGRLQTIRDFDKFFKLTYFLIVFNVLVLLVIEIINGGRFFLAPENKEFVKFEDERGLRFLGTEETFHLGVAVVFLIIDQFVSKKKNKLKLFAIIFLTIVILFTKNRAALLSLALALIIVFFLEGKAKILLRIALSVIVLLGLAFIAFPSFTQSVVSPIISAFNITNDETGNWRLLVQAVAIQESLKTPLFGQGFGGYFSYYVEALGQIINYPPHSMYVYLFQKTGIVGLLAYVVALYSLIREMSGIKKVIQSNTTVEKYRLLFKVLIIAQIPYGFAYFFSTFMGYYIGMWVVLKKINKKSVTQNLVINAAAA